MAARVSRKNKKQSPDHEKSQPKRLHVRFRVLVADDHAIMRDGLARVLNRQPDVAVVGAAANGQEAVVLARKLRPNVVVMDISMPLLNGIDATRAIKAARPRTRVIGLSMYGEPHYAAAMRQAGAEACINKTGAASELVAAILARHQALHGHF